MADLNDYILDLLSQGYHCSQVMMQLALVMRGEENPLLIRSMGGLGGGMFLRRNCGTLTGAACVLASYVPRFEGEPEPEIYKVMVKELVTWFESENGSIQCRDLVAEDMESRMEFCPGLIARTFDKVLEILEAHGFDAQSPVS